MIWNTNGDQVTLWGTDGKPVLGSGGSTPPPGNGTDPATLTTLRQVTDRTGWWRQTTTAGPSGIAMVSEHTATVPARDLRIRWGVHGWAGADDGITGRAGLVIRGRYWRLTWDGADLVTIPRLGHKTSDPLPVQVEAGDAIHAVWEAVPGSPVPSGALGWDTPTTALVNGAFTGVPAMGRAMLSGSPQGIYGLTFEDAPAIVCLGDSILESGWMRRAAHSTGAAWSDLSQWAEGIPAARLADRLTPEDPALFALGLTEYGTNNRAMPPQQAAQAMLSSWQWLTSGPVARLGQTTMVPYASSTDGWTTVAGQTATDVAWRDAINGWLRDGAPLIDGAPALTGGVGAVRAGEAGHPLIGVCDIAAAVETPNPTGLVWDTSAGVPTLDGTHPTRIGSDLMEPVAARWLHDHLT